MMAFFRDEDYHAYVSRQRPDIFLNSASGVGPWQVYDIGSSSAEMTP
ncbi:MAG: hypothetical protein L7F78_08790 [Syntrophales bacterium LBB04]|nr:hypothetical protein [Syntrophales bacterium LBB04]